MKSFVICIFQKLLFRITKSSWMKWLGHMTHMGKIGSMMLWLEEQKQPRVPQVT
jgi:hypothetical protein